MACVKVNINIFPIQLKPSISIICDATGMYYPLLVEEGVLLIQEDGVVQFLCVDKNERI